MVDHDLTAKPLSARYARRLAATTGSQVERVELPELRERCSLMAGSQEV